MANIVEVTTFRGYLRKYYKIIDDSISFEVKAIDAISIGLTDKPGNNCIFWVALSQFSSLMKTGKERNEKTHYEELLSDEYRHFTILICKDLISLTLNKEPDIPLISFKKTKELSNLKYYSVGSLNHSNRPAYWKLPVPVSLERPAPKTLISGGEPYWVPAENGKPVGAIIGGYDQEILYIMRAEHEESLTPGAYYPSSKTGHLPWGGNDNVKEQCEVLCGYNCIWMKAIENELPVGAVEAGYSEDNYETLYVGRVYHENAIIPGKIQPSHRVCYFTFEGREVATKTFEVLVAPNTNSHCYEKMYYPVVFPRDEMIGDYSEEPSNIFFDNHFI